jgi:ABC-type sugar transport system substrate-binding protein
MKKSRQIMKKEENSTRPSGGLYVFWTVVLAVMVGIGWALLPRDTAAAEEENVYTYHLAVIGGDADQPFWQLLTASISETAKDYDALAEETGSALNHRLSMEDAQRMAIYEDVDGILILPGNGEEVGQLIDEAEARGIPVITMERDVPDSQRRGFVGINDYFLGQQYGREILKRIGEGEQDVCVLFPDDRFDETSQEWFRLGLASTIRSESISFTYETVVSDASSLNDAEDIIQGLLEGEDTPDILITLDSVSTQSAFQLLTTHGMVDSVCLIGTGISSEILDGVENGGIAAVITTDPTELGRRSVEQLMTYETYHMTSYYTEVSPVLIDSSNVQQYRREFYDDSGE